MRSKILSALVQPKLTRAHLNSKKTFALRSSLVAALLISQSQMAFAQNREDLQNNRNSDALFNEPKSAIENQILLGISELLGAGAVLHSMNSQALAKLEFAERNLTNTKLLPSDQASFDRLIESMRRYQQDPRTQRELVGKLVEVGGPISPESKALMIAEAEAQIVQARANLLKDTLTVNSPLRRIVRGIKIAGSSILVLDVAGRVYVWRAFNADPSFSPSATFLISLMK